MDGKVTRTSVHRSYLEMVDKNSVSRHLKNHAGMVMVIPAILFLFFSCGFMMQTPFPEVLLYLGDSVDLSERIPYVEKSRIYVLDSYVFFLWNSNEQSGVIVFDRDLNEILSAPTGVGTLRFIDYSGNYIIGETKIIINELNPETSYYTSYDISIGEDNHYRPNGFGLSDPGIYDYYLWQDNYLWNLNLHRYDGATWTSEGSLSQDRMAELKEMFVDSGDVILVFEEETGSYRENVLIYTMTQTDFLLKFSSGSTNPFSGNPVVLEDLDVIDYYYAEGTVIIRTWNSEYIRVDMAGKIVDTGYGDMDDNISEGYSMDGEDRYLFSENLRVLMKTDVWW